jgi:hypothetical protein
MAETKMMKRIMTIMAVAALALAIGNAQAQNSQYGAVENFYQANPDVDFAEYTGRTVNPAYWLVDWNRWAEIDSRWTNGGFVRLGISSWESNNALGGGVPLKDWVLAYAYAIGADVVIYAVHTATDKYDWTAHDVAFYARTRQADSTSRPTSAEATAAINRAQDAWHEPRVKGGVRYDPRTDTYNWIGPRFGERRSKSAAWFLDHFGAYF